MAVIYLALGSNVGDSKHHINKAIELLQRKVADIEKAPIYTTKATGYTDQSDFLNTVIGGETELSPQELLIFIKQVEKEVGRIKRFRWGPREIDVDIIFYNDEVINQPDLNVPHQRFAERDFVLKPLSDLAPELVDPITRLTVKELLDKLPPSDLSVISKTE